MDIWFYNKGARGTIKKVAGLDCAVANRIYHAHVAILDNHLTTYYRVAAVDTSRGDLHVLDSDNKRLGLTR